MAGVAKAWETAAIGATARRQIVLRTAVVLDPGAPAYERLTWLTRWGLGGRIGSGRQWVSWLHIADFVAIIRHCLDDERLAGVIHATSPEPVRNTEFMAAFRHAWDRPAAPPTPRWLLRFGAGVAAHRSGAGPDRPPLRAGQADRPGFRILPSHARPRA
jgi:NAD dependent epimerase/dehydratase family enzyme